MKKKISIIIILILGIILSGCGKNLTAREAVRDYLEMYVTLDNRVVEQLNEFVDKEDLDDEQKKMYKEVLKKEYSTLTYTLEDETYDGDRAYVKAKIKVMNLNKVQKDALDYFDEHKEEFNDEEGRYDKGKFLTYKLSRMKEATETITYEIEFKADKNDGRWEVVQLSNEDLEKIHGIYEYNE